MDICIGSFDMGYVNFACYIERFVIKDIESLRQEYLQIPYKNRLRTKGIMHSDIKKIIKKTCLAGERVYTGVYSFSDETGQGLDNRSRLKLVRYLEEFIRLWSTCDIFIIEQQYFNMSKKKKKGKDQPGANVDAIKIGEIVYTWFLSHFPFKFITYFGAHYKTSALGAPKGMSKPQRKKWATARCEEIYKDRKDEDMINLFELSRAVKYKRILSQERFDQFKYDFPIVSTDADDLSTQVIINRQKLEDPSDACVQCQAFKFCAFVVCSIQYI